MRGAGGKGLVKDMLRNLKRIMNEKTLFATICSLDFFRTKKFKSPSCSARVTDKVREGGEYKGQT